MKILLTFEHGHVAIHFIDVVRMLNHLGHDVYYFEVGNEKLRPYPRSLFGNSMYFLNELGDIHQYDMWIYDLTSWECPKSPLIEKMEAFKGPMVCIGEGDGADFCIHRTSDAVRKKTALFMRNTLFKDLTRYNPGIINKMFLSTCYISNSQDFKNSAIPFEKKQKRAIFTGNLTGFAEKGNPEGEFARINIPMALVNAGVPCVYRVNGTNPRWEERLKRVPAVHRLDPLSRPDFIKEMENSMIVLAIRGNYHTVNRFFEGQAAGSLVFTTAFREDCKFYGHGDPGVHYVEIAWDGSDVVEKAKYYFDHPVEAANIAFNGRKLWEDYSMLDENKLLPKRVIDYYIKGIKEVGGISIA